MLDGLERLSAAAGDSRLAVSESVRHLCHESVGTAVKGVFSSRLRLVRQFHAQRAVEHVIYRYRRCHIVKRSAERCLAAHTLCSGIVSLSHTSESVIDIASADNHHVLVGCTGTLCRRSNDTVLLHLHGTSETVNERHGLKVIVRMLDVVVFGYCICRGGDARFAETCLLLVFKRDDVRNTGRQLVRTADLCHTSDIVKLRLIIEVVEVTAFQCHTIAVVEVARFATVAPCVVNTLDIHVHLRLVAVLVPHALSRAVGRKRLLCDVAVAVILVVGDSRSAAELLRHLRQMVRVLRVIGRGHVVIHRAVTADNGHVRGKSENVPVGIGGVLDVRRIVIAARTAAAEAALVAVAVGLQLSVVAIEVILVPCLGDNHALRCALVLLVGGVAEGNESRCTVAVDYILLGEGVAVRIGGHAVCVILVDGFSELVARCVGDV